MNELLKNNELKILLLIFLLAANFFNPFEIFGESRFCIQILQLLLLFITIKYSFKKKVVTCNLKPLYFIFYGSILASIYNAVHFHNQGLFDTLFPTFQIFIGYYLFWILLKFKLEENEIIYLIRYLLIISAIVYFINLLCFPNQIFFYGRFDDLSDTRGFVRISVPFIELHVFLLFYYIYSYPTFCRRQRKKCLLWISFTSIMILLSLTRQIIFASIVIGILLGFRRLKWWKKGLVCICLFVFSEFALQNITIVKSLFTYTREQISLQEQGNDDIRLVAFNYYTVDMQHNDITKICGNGLPAMGKGKWGKEIANATRSGLYLEDIGWTGIFYYFGFVGLISLALIFIISIIYGLRNNKVFISYWLFFIFITAIISAPILYIQQIISISVVLCLLYKNKL